MQTSKLFVLIACLAGYAGAARAECKPGAVFLKSKTAVRRGPGLNYPPSAMIEDGKCFTAGEVSIDGAWVLIDDEEKKIFGWVPSAALDDASRDALAGKKPAAGPIGSGQERGYVSVRTKTILLARPDGEVRKDVPPGSRLLALSMTEDGSWVEVRDDRGETGWVPAQSLSDEKGTLKDVPRSNTGIKTGLESGLESSGKEDVAGVAKDPASGSVMTGGPKETAIVAAPPPSGDVVVEAQLYALAALPAEQLDSNGTDGQRRYIMRARSFGAQFEAVARPLGPLSMRVGYSFLLLTGLAPKGQPQEAIGGQKHEGRLLFGFPIPLGAVELTPELGYVFSLFAIQPNLPSARAPQFFSSHSHAANVGFAALITFVDGFALSLDAAGLFGTTIEYPFDLGASGLTIGGRGGAGFRVGLGGGANILARYAIRYREAPFKGPSPLDMTITEARLINFEQGFSLGVAFTL